MQDIQQRCAKNFATSKPNKIRCVELFLRLVSPTAAKFWNVNARATHFFSQTPGLISLRNFRFALNSSYQEHKYVSGQESDAAIWLLKGNVDKSITK